MEFHSASGERGRKRFLIASAVVVAGICTFAAQAIGSFSGAANFAAGNSPQSVAIGNLNGDGNQDLAVANSSDDNVSILLGNGAGSFGAATNFAADDGPRSVAVSPPGSASKTSASLAASSAAIASIRADTVASTSCSAAMRASREKGCGQWWCARVGCVQSPAMLRRRRRR